MSRISAMFIIAVSLFVFSLPAAPGGQGNEKHEKSSHMKKDKGKKDKEKADRGKDKDSRRMSKKGRHMEKIRGKKDRLRGIERKLERLRQIADRLISELSTTSPNPAKLLREDLTNTPWIRMAA